MTAYQVPITDTLISRSVFGHTDSVREWYDIAATAMQELKTARDGCISLQAGASPTKECVSLLVRVAMKFHAGDTWYVSFEGSNTIDSMYVRALVFSAIDSYINREDILDCMFGGNVATKKEFTRSLDRMQGPVSVSACMRMYAGA